MKLLFAAALSAVLMAGASQAAVVGGAVTGGTTPLGTFVELSPGVGFNVGNDNQQSNNLFAFDEKQNLALLSALTPDVGGLIAAGTRVSSHYVFYDPVAGRRVGYVDFYGSVLGILTSTGRLSATDAALGRSGVNYLSPGLRGLEPGDFATFTAKRVFVDFTASSPGDYVRVLTTGAVPEPATWGLMLLGFGLVGAALRRRPAHA